MGAYIKRRICLLMAFIMIAGSLPVTAQDSDYALSCPPTLSEDEIYDLPEFLVASPSAFDTMMVEPFSETESISWTVNPVDADVNVTRVSGNHILELNLTPEEKDMLGDISSATLVIGVSPAFGARRLAVWSDLTGRDEDGSVAENVNNITFLSSANLGVANRIVRTSGLSGATSATLTIPTSMLTNGADTASKIYIATTTDSNLNPPDHPTSPGNPEALTLAANHRGGGTSNEFNNFQSVVLNVVEGLPTIGTIFDLQAHIAGMPTGTFANTTHLISSHTGGTPENVVLGIATGGSPAPPAGITRYLTVNRQQANRTRGLLLRGIPLEAGDTITVHGRLVTTTTGLRMAFQEEAVTGNMQSLPIGHGEFTMTYTVSPGLAESSNQNIRIIAHGEAGTADVAALFRVYNITVYREDRSADIVRVQNPAMGGVFEVVSPYSTVNWNTWHQFRAAHHTHTIRSDGAASHRDMLVDHYNRGFSIVASTDHNVIENGDWTTHPPEPTVNHWTPRQWDHASNLMTTAEQDLINAGTWTVGSGRALPTGSRFSALGFMRPQMRGILGLPGTPTGTNAGMISVPNSNEQTIRDHVLTYWLNHNSSNASSSVDTEVVITNLLTQVQNSTNGMAVFAHPGRHTCGRATRCSMHSNSGNRCEHSGAAGNIAASNLPREVNRYVTRFNNFSRAIGMEIYNRPDHESRSDRILWDNILMEIMPQRERNVWGFANDDSHSMDGTGLGWNVMLMPSLTDGNHRTAMRDGTFYMVSRIDRRLGVNAGQGTGAAGGWHEPLMNRQAPAITNISVTGQTITITGVNYDEILWITGNPFRAGFPGTPADVTQGGGVVIHAEEFNAAGNSLNLAQTGRYVWGNYVRAVLVCRTGHGSRINSHGVALTQPFGVYRLNCTTCSNSGNCCNACGNVCVGGCTSTPCQFLANPIRHMSAAQVVSGIGAGWNLGNRFDARGHETQWVNPATTQANIRAIKAGGFNAIRIPVTWTSIGTGSPANAQAAATWTIPPAWMNRVRDVVRWAYDEDMYVILNIHHENFIYDNLTANTDLAEQILVNLWTQICAAFNNQFGYRLIFAGLNEPRIIGTQANPRPDEWRGGTPAERIAINRLNQTFVNTVRNSKGNNEYRSLMVPTHAASATNAALRGIETSVTGANGRTMPPTASAFVMPSDPSPATNNRLIMSVHTYSPYDFAFRQRDSQGNVIGLGTTNWSTSGSSAAGPERIDFYFANIQARANELGVPVILGEWGTENKDNTSARVTHATYYVTQARQRGWPTFWWDNNRLDDANSERFALFNPSNNSWRFDTLRAAIIAAATPNPTPVSVTVNSLATTVPQGGTLQFTAQVAPSSASQAVAWTINPSVNGVSISSTGLLTVGSSVPVNQQITVRATAVGHNTVFGTRQVTVSGITATGVTVTAADDAETVLQGGTLAFSASVIPVNAPQTVTWSINPAVNGAAISTTGVLTVGSSVAVGTDITIRATASTGTNVFGQSIVTVTSGTINPTGVTVSAAGGATTVTRGGTLAFSAVVAPEGAPQAVTWSLVSAVNGASIDANTGVLTVTTAANAGAQINVRATVVGHTSITDTMTVTVSDIVPTGVTVSAAGGATTVTRGSTLAFSAVVAPEGAPQAVTWSLVSAVNGASIDANTGVLTVTTAANAGAQINVRATVVGHTSITDTMAVTVSDIVPTGVTVSAAGGATTVTRGSTLAFSAVVAPEGAPQAVTWSLVSAVNGASIDANTGVLTVTTAANVGAQINVRATVVGYTSIIDTMTVTVSDIVPTGVIVSATGGATTVTRGSTLAFSAEVAPEGAPQAVTWSLVSAVNGASIDANTGVLTVTTAANAGAQINVRATVVGHTSITDTMTVTVSDIVPTGVTVSAAGGATTVMRGSTLEFSAVVAPEGAPQAVTWSLVSAVNGASIDADTGVLTVATAANVGAQINVRATVVGHTSITNTRMVTVSDVVPTSVTVSAANNATTVTIGTTLQFSAEVFPEGAPQAVTWSLVSPVQGVSISTTGLLTVNSSVAPNTTINVRARVVGHTSVTGTATVTTTAIALQTLTAPPATFQMQTAAANAAAVISALPSTAAVTTTPANITSINIAWSLVGATFNSAPGAVNNFTWLVTLPNTINNPNNIVLTGTTAVTNFYVLPVITKYDAPNWVRDFQYSFQFEATGVPAPTWTSTGTLPNGLSLSATGLLSGIPTTLGEFTFTVIASTSTPQGSDSKEITIQILATGTPPQITVFNPPDASDGRPFSFTFAATGLPVPTWSVAPGSELPQGLTLEANGRLHGVPVFSDIYTFNVVASNGAGEDAVQQVSMGVAALKTANTIAPTVSVSGAFAGPGDEVTVQVRVDNNPGFSSMVLRFDIPDELTLVRHESHPQLEDFEYGFEEGESEFFGWIGSTKNFNMQGTLLTMTFEVSASAQHGLREITAAFESYHGIEFPFNEDEEELTDFEIANGSVTVRTLLIGDIDGDGHITSADATLLAKWLIEQHVSIDLDAVNLTGEGICGFTLTLLSRWLVGHDVSHLIVKGS